MTDPNFLSVIGARIRELRRMKGVTQKILAIKCGLEEANISRIEAGKTNMTILTIYKISTVLGVKMTDLLKEY